MTTKQPAKEEHHPFVTDIQEFRRRARVHMVREDLAAERIAVGLETLGRTSGLR